MVTSRLNHKYQKKKKHLNFTLTNMWRGWSLEWQPYHRKWRSCHHWEPCDTLHHHEPCALSDLHLTGPTHQYTLQQLQQRINHASKPNAHSSNPTWCSPEQQLGLGRVNANTEYSFLVRQCSHLTQGQGMPNMHTSSFTQASNSDTRLPIPRGCRNSIVEDPLHRQLHI